MFGHLNFLMLFAILIILIPNLTRASDLVEGEEATFFWTAATGPVWGYAVYVARNDVWGTVPEQLVRDTESTITGEYGDKIKLKVAARDTFGNQGMFSQDSVPILFTAPDAGEPPEEPEPIPVPPPPPVVIPDKPPTVDLFSPAEICRDWPAWKEITYSDCRKSRVRCLKEVVSCPAE